YGPQPLPVHRDGHWDLVALAKSTPRLSEPCDSPLRDSGYDRTTVGGGDRIGCDVGACAGAWAYPRGCAARDAISRRLHRLVRVRCACEAQPRATRDEQPGGSRNLSTHLAADHGGRDEPARRVALGGA